MVRRGWMALIVVVVLSMAGLAAAQVTSGSITGLVQDESGGAMPGVTITVKSEETGATRTAVTDSEGRYRVPGVRVGRYEVRAELEGFSTAVHSGINLTVNQEVVVRFQMKVGELRESVTVTTEAPLVNTTTAQTSGLVGEREVKDLP